MRGVGSREDPIERGRERGRRLDGEIRGEIRDGRMDRSISQRALGRRVGMSASEVSRIERGLVPLDVVTASTLLSGVGKELSVRAYPAGPPVRDAGHTALLGRLRSALVPGLELRTEVPLPIPGDQRAWDAMIVCGGCRPPWRMPVEAESRPRDWQALDRRIALKMRDGAVEAVLLVLADTRHNRLFVRLHAEAIAATFPVAGRDAMAALADGRHPGGSALVLL